MEFLDDVDDDEEILRVFQLMGPDDNIVVTKDDKGNTHLKDEETGKEYMIVGESEEEARQWMLDEFQIASRAELKNNPEAARQYMALQQEYLAWKQSA